MRAHPLFRAALVLLGTLATVSPAIAQAPDSACGDGLIYDDGSFENAYGLVASAGRKALLMRLDPPVGTPIERICLCWVRNTLDDALDFDLVFYDAAESGREPGSLLGRVPATASSVPSTPPGAFFAFDVGSADIVAPAGGLFVGAEWDAAAERGFFLCADQNGPSTQPGVSGAPGEWRALTEAHPSYRALAIRATLGYPPCQPDATTLCLRDDRFQARVSWRTPAGATGEGHPVAETSGDSGLFWFFRAANWELLVKVLDGCAVNGHFWVFAAATTHVGYTLTVTDLATGEARIYDNPVGAAAPALTDTEALSSCPTPREATSAGALKPLVPGPMPWYSDQGGETTLPASDSPSN